MRGRWCLLAFVLSLGAVLSGPASGQDEPPILRLAGAAIAAGAWTYDFDLGGLLVLTDEGPITGFAFGPGRAEVAYCAPAGPEGRWGLWVATVSFPAPDAREYPLSKTDARPRLLWAAPPGVTLRGPVWWAADGSMIAVCARRDDSSDVVAVGYAEGRPMWLCRGAEVVDFAWSPAGERVAYVTEEEGSRAVWLQTMPPGEARRLGDGGFDLRWSLDGQSVRWLKPKSSEVWVRATWDGATGEVTETSPQPARPSGTMWSPDGQRCAILQPAEGREEMKLLIYSTQGTVAEEVVLPHVRPTRLLGWSPDGRLVLVLGDADFPVAVAAVPMDDGIRSMVQLTGWPSGERGTICAFPIAAEAGPPSWSSGCDMLAYATTTKFDERLPSDPDGEYLGCLVAQLAFRRHVEPPTPEQLEARIVLSNLKNVALALQMYLSDYDVFPPSGESEEVWRILDEYVKNRSVFMRPGTEDEMVTRYLVPPGVRPVDIRDPARLPVAVVDYLPDAYVVAYADGHAAVREKGNGYWEELMAPWEEYWAEREEGD